MMRTLLLGVVAFALVSCGVYRTENDESVTPRVAEGTPNVAATVSAGFGRTEPFESYESAERRLGWRMMRPADLRFRLGQQGGLLRTDSETGLTRIEQAYAMEGREGLIHITQQPEAFAVPNLTPLVPYAIGPFNGELDGRVPHGLFVFASGQRVEGQDIRVLVYTHESSDLSEQDFIDFVTSLSFGDP